MDLFPQIGVCVSVDLIHKGRLITVFIICLSCIISSTPAGCQRVEHLPPEHHFGYR